MKDYIKVGVDNLLICYNLSSYEELWAIELPEVDQPNLERGGWSSVSYLELNDTLGIPHGFYIKRQVNHLTRTVHTPFGGPTFGREMRNILLYKEKGVPALEAAYYTERRTDKGIAAILITCALETYRPLDQLILDWQSIDVKAKNKILKVVGTLVGKLHSSRLAHRCLYPKHIFIDLENTIPARFIDLEKSRFLWLPKRDSIADLSSLLTRANAWNEVERDSFLKAYLCGNSIGLSLQDLQRSLVTYRQNKDNRRKKIKK